LIEFLSLSLFLLFIEIACPQKKIMFTNLEPPPYEDVDSEEANKETVNSPVQMQQQTREEKYRDIIRKHEISADFANRLQLLQGFKTVFIFDDSGSMNTVLQDSPLNTGTSLFRATRWEELQYFAKISIEIATIFDEAGCDIYFLNRMPSPVFSIRTANQLTPLFQRRPEGYTPLPRVLNSVLADNRMTANTAEKKLLIIIATDGEPTDDFGRASVFEFKQALLSRGPRVFTTVVVGTDDEESVKYLNRWDRKLPNLDVVDDFRNEREEIRKVKGSRFPFSFGDYVVKSLIGSIDPELDQLDEHSQCCTAF
jgi:hypothetical protein